MKKMKKIFAMLLAFTMVLGMTMTASAAEPVEGETTTATVKGVEEGENVTVTAYQIVEGKYNKVTKHGFLGYKVVDGVTIADKTFQPTSDEITTIAAAINNGLTLNSEEMTRQSNGDFTAKLTAGYWIVLVRETVSVYNPMLIGVYYDVNGSGDDSVLNGGEVDAEDNWGDGTNWVLTAQDAYAKKSEIDITKKITSADKKSDVVGDVAYGDTVSFEINTTVPDYSAEFDTEVVEDKVVFKITDILDAGLDLKADTVTVTTSKAAVKGTDYTITTSEHRFVVEFTPEWLLVNGASTVKVTYSAEVNENARTNFVPNKNEVYLTYTNNPGEDVNTEVKTTRHYTFEIDGAVNGTGSEVTEEIRKMGTEIIEGEEVTNPLAGARFALRKKGETDVTKYKYAVSDGKGLLNFKGLDADVEYEIFEVEAPKGWTINDTVYTAKITATYDNEGVLTKYEVKITNDKDTTVATSIHEEKLVNEVKKVVTGNATTDVPNTKLVALPSTGGIGTTIFTVAGCGIMIAAAFFFFASRKKENE